MRYTRLLKLCMVLLVFCIVLVRPVAMASAETAFITVNIPDFVVESSEDYDQVSLPGGQMLLAEEGRPQVPYWIWTRDFPPGQHVGDVQLVSRLEPQVVGGYRLPPVILTDDPAVPAGLTLGWYPTDSMQWLIQRNYDGSSLLIVHLFPLFYHPESRTIEFYRQHRLEIDVVEATASLLSVASDRQFYQAGDPVVLDIRLENAGDRQDFFLNLLIRDTRSGEEVDGLPVMRLADLAGEASYTATWHQPAMAASDYQVELVLADRNGAVIDVAFINVILLKTGELPTTNLSPVPSATTDEEDKKPGEYADWLIVGIVGAIVVFIAALGFGVYWLIRRRSRH